MKRVLFCITILFSFGVLANECQEARLQAQIDYEAKLNSAYNQTGGLGKSYNIYSSGNYEESNIHLAKSFLLKVVNLKNMFMNRLSSAENELFKLNYKKALREVETISKGFDETLNESSDEYSKTNYQNIDNDQIWVCRYYSDPKKNQKGSAFCLKVGLPNFNIISMYERSSEEFMKEMIYLPDPLDQSKYGKKNYNGFNFAVTREEFINKASKSSCEGAVTTAARSDSTKVQQESSVGQSTDSSHQK